MRRDQSGWSRLQPATGALAPAPGRRLKPPLQAKARSTSVGGERGVTLIELLIAVTLTAAISVGLLLAMRVSLLTYEKLNQRLEDNRYTVGIQQTLERQISGVIPI